MGGRLIDTLRRYDNLLELPDDTEGKQDALESVARELITDTDAAADYLKHRAAMAQEINDFITDAMRALKRLEQDTTRIKALMMLLMMNGNIKTLQGTRRTISLQEREKTVIDDAAKLPEQYTRQKVSVEPDKKAIKDAIHAGEYVPGARLEKSMFLSVRG